MALMSLAASERRKRVKPNLALASGLLARATVLHAFSVFVIAGMVLHGTLLSFGSPFFPLFMVIGWPALALVYWRIRVHRSPFHMARLSRPGWASTYGKAAYSLLVGLLAALAGGGLYALAGLGLIGGFGQLLAGGGGILIWASMMILFFGPLVPAWAVLRAEVRALGLRLYRPPDGEPHRCSFCELPVAGDDTHCEACLAPHHSECWDFCGGCAAWKCSGATAQQVIDSEAIGGWPAASLLIRLLVTWLAVSLFIAIVLLSVF